jgi:hypothetical protein
LEAKKLKLATKGFLFFRKGFLGCNVVSQGEIRTFNKEKKNKNKNEKLFGVRSMHHV